MEKKKLIKSLMIAVELEEDQAAVITKFLKEDFDWESIEKSKVDRIKELLGILENQTMEHARLINELIGMLRERDVDHV